MSFYILDFLFKIIPKTFPKSLKFFINIIFSGCVIVHPRDVCALLAQTPSAEHQGGQPVVCCLDVAIDIFAHYLYLICLNKASYECGLPSCQVIIAQLSQESVHGSFDKQLPHSAQRCPVVM